MSRPDLKKDKKLLVLILGRSGAGITSAVKAMQDTGFFVIDNLPLKLAEATIEMMESKESGMIHEGYAFGFHAYSDPDLEKLNEVKKTLGGNFTVDVLFLKAKKDVLARRFTTTRRPHPLVAKGGDLLASIELEKKILRPLEKASDLVIDTTELNTHVLARYLEARFLGHMPQRKLLISLTSFGFKHEYAPAFDLVFDVRFLKNPYFNETLREKTGLDNQTAEFVRSDERYSEFLGKLTSLLSFLVPHYYGEGKTYLRIGVGCTGGKHRSVTVVRDLESFFKRKDFSFVHVTTDHKNISKT